MPQKLARFEMMDDVELARRAVRREALAIRTITTRNNQRLFRTAWSVLRNHADAEDVVQEAYLKAFNSMESYGWKVELIHMAYAYCL